MSTNISFDYSLSPNTVLEDRRQYSVGSLDEKGLRKIGKGKIIVIDERARCYFTIESQVLDYLVQLAGVVSEFEKGNHETFAVSPDYYSNNLKFKYDPASRKIEVYEANGGTFKLHFQYKSFRTSFLAFYSQVIDDFQLLYPELTENPAFRLLHHGINPK